MLPGNAPSAVQRTMAAYHARVLAMETEQMREMARRWLGVEASLEARISALSMEIAVAQLKGEKVSAARLYQMEHYQALLRQARIEIQGYNQWAADLIGKRQAEMARLGIRGTEAAIEESYREAGVVKTSYHRLPVEAVEKMIGMAGDQSPLSELFKTSYPETMLALTQALVDATAQGDNPRETARRMTDAMAGNLQRALVIARTEQLRAFRMASLESMKESGVVEGWIWRSALQDRTCAACLAMDGTLHSFDEQLDDHPQGRCWMQPKIKGLEPVQAEAGKDWFERQDEATQRSILGSARYEAWKEGKFDFSQLAGRRHSEEWGTTVKIKNLEELISNRIDTDIREAQLSVINKDKDIASLGDFDFRSLYDKATIIESDYSLSKEIITTSNRANHIFISHPIDYEWMRNNPQIILQALNNPLYVDKEPVARKVGYSIALVIPTQDVSSNSYPYFVVVIKLSKSKPNLLYTAFRADKRYLFDEGSSLKARWKEIKK